MFDQKEYNKRYYAEHKEELKALHKRYYNEHKEETIKKAEDYIKTRKEKTTAYKNQWYQENKENLKAKANKRYHEEKSTKEGRAAMLSNTYKTHDKYYKGFDNSEDISKDYILERIFTAKCIYCGNDNWKCLGADRIDNSKPHTPDNVVPACGICNIDRQYKKMSVEEYIEYRKLFNNKKAPLKNGALVKRNL